MKGSLLAVAAFKTSRPPTSRPPSLPNFSSSLSSIYISYSRRSSPSLIGLEPLLHPLRLLSILLQTRALFWEGAKTRKKGGGEDRRERTKTNQNFQGFPNQPPRPFAASPVPPGVGLSLARPMPPVLDWELRERERRSKKRERSEIRVG